MTANNVAIEEFESLAKDIVAKYDALGMRASGNFEKELVVEQTITDVLTSTILYGAKYTEQLVNGRLPGKYPPATRVGNKLRWLQLEKWIEDKGINTSGVAVSTLAFLIARKLASVGSNYFQQGGTDLLSSVITPQRIQKILNRITQKEAENLVKLTTNLFKELGNGNN